MLGLEHLTSRVVLLEHAKNRPGATYCHKSGEITKASLLEAFSVAFVVKQVECLNPFPCTEHNEVNSWLFDVHVNGLLNNLLK